MSHRGWESDTYLARTTAAAIAWVCLHVSLAGLDSEVFREPPIAVENMIRKEILGGRPQN